ncbi:hypothetical protein E1A91_D11G052900v1 [Gossypium mustelinum]|uniref:Precursor of CEP9 n=1 Tax=Gossypium mustelinum TaxID=34275 RepID=A0A5D2SNM8_GOSMU|nr:hypothetical protein E1A91_D11G052900v1 [Gossypium mustelinum]
MEFRPMHKFAVFVVAVIVCSHLVFSVNARPMKLHKADHPQSNAKQVLPPSIPLPAKTSGFGESHAQDFKRTSPGHSPGVGHVFSSKNSKKNV